MSEFSALVNEIEELLDNISGITPLDIIPYEDDEGNYEKDSVVYADPNDPEQSWKLIDVYVPFDDEYYDIEQASRLFSNAPFYLSELIVRLREFMLLFNKYKELHKEELAKTRSNISMTLSLLDSISGDSLSGETSRVLDSVYMTLSGETRFDKEKGSVSSRPSESKTQLPDVEVNVWAAEDEVNEEDGDEFGES